MGKGDYYVIAAKILTYLYKKYKCERLDADYITPLTKDFPIPEQQLKETIVMMEERGFIKGEIVKDAEGEAVYIEYHSLKITPAGIDYMTDNGKIRKAIGTLKEAATIMGLFR